MRCLTTTSLFLCNCQKNGKIARGIFCPWWRIIKSCFVTHNHMLIILRTKKWGSLFLVVHRKGGHTTTLNDYMLQTIPPRRHLANKSQTTTDQSGWNVLWGVEHGNSQFLWWCRRNCRFECFAHGTIMWIYFKSVSSSNRVGSVGNDNSNWNDLTILKTGERREGVHACERVEGVATPAKIPLSKKL